MSSDQAGLENLITHAREGNAAAITQLLDQYRAYLALLANIHLDPQFQPNVGESERASRAAASTLFGTLPGCSTGRTPVLRWRTG